MTLPAHHTDPISYTAVYGHNIRPILAEIALLERLSLYGENKRLLTNAKRRLRAVYKKTGYNAA